MANARICDICGTFYDHKIQFVKSNTLYKEGRPIMKIEIFADGISKEFDICPECGEKLRNHLGRDITNLH